MNKNLMAFAIAAVAGLASAANADVLVTYTYDDLAGSYDQPSSTFRAVAVDNAVLQSSGDASRLVGTPGQLGNASFDAGFVSLASFSDFQLDCDVINIVGFTAQTLNGSFTATDVNGDRITGHISGNWGRPAPGFIFFNGALDNVQMITTGNGLFEGDAGGSWDMNLAPAPSPYTGALVQLVFGGSTFFTANFSNRAVGVTAQIIPTPGAIALLGLAGVAGLRRRSR